jgi:hypothetical protein
MSNNSLYLFVTVGAVCIAAGAADKYKNFNQSADQQDPEEKKK